MKFRQWIQEKWYEHLDEQINFNQKSEYNAQEYFQKYKYWLKREYRHQKEMNNV